MQKAEYASLSPGNLTRIFGGKLVRVTDVLNRAGHHREASGGAHKCRGFFTNRDGAVFVELVNGHAYFFTPETLTQEEDAVEGRMSGGRRKVRLA